MIDQEISPRRPWVETTWTGVFNGRGQDDAAETARKALLVRYHEAVRRYFLAKVRDPNAAYDLYSNFAVRLIESDHLIRNADPARGKFRHYLKTTLQHMVIDYYRKRAGKQPLSLEIDLAEKNGGDIFDPILQQEWLNQAWKALEYQDRRTGRRHYPVLLCQTENPGLDSRRLADLLSRRLGKPYTTDGFRKALQRAREQFAELLLAEIESWLDAPTVDELEEVLIEQHLLLYCRSALEARRCAARPTAPGSYEEGRR